MPAFTLRINGASHQVDGAAGDTLLTVLRYELGLTGSKYGCGEGQCGACTVLVDGATMRSCVTRLETLAGKNITTIEALAPAGALHPIQEAFLEVEAFQCGYCTPGMVMASVSLLQENPNPTEEEVRIGLEGNLCRCTGYHNIVQSVLAAAKGA
jgi:aerobic-type carbon monoxide dehydrogenase small subunit (CoxS/CutS family)